MNPAALAYLHPSIPLAQYSRYVSRYYGKEINDLGTSLLLIVGWYAVARSLVPPAARLQFQERAIKVGRRIYYLLQPVELSHRAVLRAREGSGPWLNDWDE
jgi:hypothetical protein